jgi:hypothetical protein
VKEAADQSIKPTIFGWKWPLALFMLFMTAWCVSPALSQNDTADNTTTPPAFAPSYQTADPSAEQGPSSLLNQLSYLEFRVFARTYRNEDVDKRLDHLERVVYGAKKTGDVDQRLADLMRDVSTSQYGSSSGAGAQPASTDDSYTSSPTFTPSAQPTSLLDVVASMEKEVFGRTYTQDKLLDRVARLEKTVLPPGSEQSFTPLSTRIRKLLAALQPAIKAPATSPSSSFVQSQADSQDYSPSYSYPASAGSTETDQHAEKKDPDGHPLWKKFGKILAGVGTVAGEAIGSMAYGSAMGYGYGYGGFYPGYLGGWGGYGYGMPYYGGYRRYW